MVCEIKSLNKKYGKKVALSNVSLDLDKHIYGILGENGAGKSTLLKCICGLVSYKGKIILECGKKRIGYMPQEFTLFSNLTVEENMEFFAGYKGKNAAEEISDLLEKTGLTDKSSAKVESLSGGMLRRLGLAQSLLGNPEILILDEPTAGLDPEERIRFRSVIEKVCRGRCVLITTHIMQDVENLCDRLIVMHEGKVCFDDETAKAAEFAAGKVYCIPKYEVISRGMEEAVIQYYTADEPMARVIIEEETDETPVSPTIEDGYLCLLNDVRKKSK